MVCMTVLVLHHYTYVEEPQVMAHVHGRLDYESHYTVCL